VNSERGLRAWRDVDWEPSHEELEPFVSTLCDDIVKGRLLDEDNAFYTTTELFEEYLSDGYPAQQEPIILAALDKLVASANPGASVSALALLAWRFGRVDAVPQLLQAAANGGESPGFFEAMSALVILIEAGNMQAGSGLERLLASEETHDDRVRDVALHVLYSLPGFQHDPSGFRKTAREDFGF
jgi:hypothetical protein